MPLLLLPIFSFLKANWKVVGILVLVVMLVSGIYIKGRRDCERRVESITHKELEKRHEADQQEQTRLTKIRQKINQNRNNQPINDHRDSCLLSSDPYKTRCIP